MTPQRLVYLTALGSGLEYYDFVIYAFAAPIFAQIFFPEQNEALGLIQALAIFATGYLARPLGGIFFGSIGDRFGRKHSFTLAILLMATATVSIALLPGYRDWGWSAPCLLLMLRILQGIAQGAELPGALTFIAEHAGNQTRGHHLGILFMGVGIGSTMANLVFFALHHYLSPEALLSTGWRIAFLLGGAIAFFAYILRRRAAESPLFLKQTLAPTHQPMKSLLKTHRREIMLGIILTWFPGSVIIYFLFLPNLLENFFHYPKDTAWFLCVLTSMISAFSMPFWGKVSDRMGRQRLFQLSLRILLLGIPLLFFLISLGNTIILITALVLYQLAMGALAACYPILLTQLFPTAIRYSGTALSYNLAFTLAGATPMLLAHLLSRHPHVSTLMVSFILMAALSLISMHFYRKIPIKNLALNN